MGDNDEVVFKSKTGVFIEAIMKLLVFYSSSTYAGWEGKIFVQKSAACIGASVGPGLSDIFLEFFG